jgi:hypothetical protein
MKTLKAICTIALGFIMPVHAIVNPKPDVTYRCTLKGVVCSRGIVEPWSHVYQGFKSWRRMK